MFKSKLVLGLLFAVLLALLIAQMGGHAAGAQSSIDDAHASEQGEDAPVVHIVPEDTSVGTVLSGGGGGSFRIK